MRRQLTRAAFVGAVVASCLLPFVHADVQSVDPATPSTTQASIANPTTLPSDASQLVEFLQARLAKIQTIQANFVQTKQLKMFDRQLVLKGRLALHKPDQMAWHVDEPVRYTMIMDGHRLRQWDKDTNQIQTINIDQEPAAREIFRQFHAWLAGDLVEIAKAYDPAVVNQHPLTIEFTPKAGSSITEAVHAVRIAFGDDYRSIQQMHIEEASGDITTVEFSQTKLDEPIPQSSWEIPPR